MHAALLIFALLLAGCAITPRRVEFATNKAEQCAKGCVILTGKRIQFRYPILKGRPMRLAIILAAALLLSACETFNLGSFAYIAHGQSGRLEVATPVAASQPAR